MSTRDAVRILIQDNSVLSYDDITAVLEVEDNVYYAASFCCDALAAHYSSKVDMDVDGIQISNSQKFEHYTELAKKYARYGREGRGEGSSASVGTGVILTGVSNAAIDSVDSDSDRVSSLFKIDMFTNTTDDYEEGD